MFVHRVAGPSRLSMPAKLAPPRSRKTTILTNDGLGCFLMVQRHKSRMSQNPNAPREPRTKKREVGDIDAMKKQGKQMAKMGKRGQEKKSIDSSIFPTLDVELIEEQKYPRQLYFPYMPRRLRDWPIFEGLSLEGALFLLLTPAVGLFKEGRLPPSWSRFLSAPRRTFRAINATIIATKEALSLTAPASSASLENHPSRSTPTAASISAPGTTDSPSQLDGPSLKIALQTSTDPGKAPLLAASTGNESDSAGIAIIGNPDASLPSTLSPTASQVTRVPSMFSKLFRRTFFVLLRRRYPPSKWVRRTYKLLKSVYTVVHGFIKEHWTWWYLDPGYWSPQRRREVWAGMKRIRAGLWKDATNYIQESEKYGKDAREYYMKKLENDRNNWSAMKLIATYNRFPDHNWDHLFYKGLAVRNLSKPWFDRKQRQQRLQENALFSDISSPKSLLAPILRSVKDLYVEMNEAIAAGRIDDLNQYAAKRYLNEIERRATSVRRGRETVSQTCKFERWVNAPECISLRAKDFFADYPGAYQGDHLVLNLLVKLDSWQSLVTIEGPKGREGRRRGRGASRVVETKRVTEYIVIDFRTWIWEGKPRFIQEIYPGQKLDLITNQTTERKMLRQLKKKEAEEREELEDEAGQGKSTVLKPST